MSQREFQKGLLGRDDKPQFPDDDPAPVSPEATGMTPQKALAAALEGQGLYRGPYGAVAAGRATAPAILAALAEAGLSIVPTADLGSEHAAMLSHAQGPGHHYSLDDCRAALAEAP